MFLPRFLDQAQDFLFEDLEDVFFYLGVVGVQPLNGREADFLEDEGTDLGKEGGREGGREGRSGDFDVVVYF